MGYTAGIRQRRGNEIAFHGAIYGEGAGLYHPIQQPTVDTFSRRNVYRHTTIGIPNVNVTRPSEKRDPTRTSQYLRRDGATSFRLRDAE